MSAPDGRTLYVSTTCGSATRRRTMPEGPHWMLPGSHERGYGPECRCGADWDRWNDRCCVDTAALAGSTDDTTREAPEADHG